jgi:Ca-activated chloride channel family protein
MSRACVFCGMLLLLLVAVKRERGFSHAVMAQSQPVVNFNVAVDEVVVTFHAEDANGLPINDLRQEELTLLDDGKPPGKILSFKPETDVPIRAAFMIDTSDSMEKSLFEGRIIARKYTQMLFRQQTDQAFVMDFGSASKIAQPWTDDANLLSNAIREVVLGGENPVKGTRLFDALYRACFYEFGKTGPAASGNFILLFSDGEDNASHASMKDVIESCQNTNTAIYVFRAEDSSGRYSAGPKILAELAAQSGGQVFNLDSADAVINSDLRRIEANNRNQYRVVYKPAELKHDGAFRRIQLLAKERAGEIVSRSGYYAPAH